MAAQPRDRLGVVRAPLSQTPPTYWSPLPGPCQKRREEQHSPVHGNRYIAALATTQLAIRRREGRANDHKPTPHNPPTATPNVGYFTNSRATLAIASEPFPAADSELECFPRLEKNQRTDKRSLAGKGPLFQPESGVAVVARGEDAGGHEVFPLSRPVRPFLDRLHRGETAREARIGNLTGPSLDEANSGQAARKGEARLVFAHGARHPPDRQRQLPEFSWTLRSQTLIRGPALPPANGRPIQPKSGPERALTKTGNTVR
jgi:hypothetical protein